MKRSELVALRRIIEAAAQSLPDERALEAVCLHPLWAGGAAYEAGFKARYNGALYKCLTAHTAQDGWTPAVSPSLWAKVLVEDGAILAWEQPDSTNGYRKGDKVTHNGRTWVSDVDSNIWEPGVFGWTEVA